MISMSCEGTSRACTIDIGTWHVLCVHISNRSPLGPPQPRAPCRSMPAAKKAAAPAVLPDLSLLDAAYSDAEARPTIRARKKGHCHHRKKDFGIIWKILPGQKNGLVRL